MRTYSDWWEFQRGWRLVVQIVVVVAAVVVLYVVGGVLGKQLGIAAAKAEVWQLNQHHEKPSPPALPPPRPR